MRIIHAHWPAALHMCSLAKPPVYPGTYHRCESESNINKAGQAGHGWDPCPVTLLFEKSQVALMSVGVSTDSGRALGTSSQVMLGKCLPNSRPKNGRHSARSTFTKVDPAYKIFHSCCVISCKANTLQVRLLAIQEINHASLGHNDSKCCLYAEPLLQYNIS